MEHKQEKSLKGVRCCKQVLEEESPFTQTEKSEQPGRTEKRK